MRLCFDTNSFLSIFSRRHPYPILLRSFLTGKFTLLISNEILFEYREIFNTRSGPARWQDVLSLLETTAAAHGTVVEISPNFRFSIISQDPDDNKFCDCAIAGNAHFIVTQDRHFAPLREAGYQPQPITPEELAILLEDRG